MSAERRNLPAVVEAAVPVKRSSLRSTLAVPAVIAGAGDHAARRFLEFFAATMAAQPCLREDGLPKLGRRCSYLHQASSNVSKQQTKLILDHHRFVSPLKGWTFGTHLVDGRILQINVETFCDLMCTGAEKWTRSVLERQDEVQLRSEELLKVHDARIDGILVTGRSPPSTEEQPETGNTHTPENKHDNSLGIPRTQKQAPLDLTKK